MSWKYIDASNRVVFRPVPGGGIESCLLAAIQDWIDQGNTPDPADVPDPAPAIEAAKAQVRVVREAILNRLAGIALAANLSGDTATTAAYIVARQGLLDITANLPATLPEVTAAIATRYVAIAITARATSPTLADAFNQVDA